MGTIRVVIAEDHAVVRQGLRVLIHADPDLQVAGEAEDGVTAVQMVEKLRPDVVVMDLSMPRMNGLNATRHIVKNSPGSKVLVLSSYSDDDSVASLLQAGAAGYITKHSASEDLLKAIREVRNGKPYLSPRIAQRLRRLRRNVFPPGKGQGVPLSSRELEVLRMIALGLATKEIARDLGLSVKTAEKHRQSLMDKLDVHEIAGLTRYAEDHGLLPRPRPESPSQTAKESGI